MSHFHSLKVSDIVKETSDCVSIGFEIPNELKEEFKFKHGQNITVRLKMNGEELRRSYSICIAPYEPGLRVAVKKVKDGRVSIYLNENIKKGDFLEVMAPTGTFTIELHPYNKKTYNLFAAGSGITPIISILKTALAFESQAKVNLFYGNLNEDSIVFKNEIDELQVKYSGRLNVFHTLDNPKTSREELLTGRISKEKAKIFATNHIDSTRINEFFICGPGEMMENVKEALLDLNIPKNKIHLEYFLAPPDAGKENVDKSLFVPAEVTIICDDDERVTFVEPHQSLLDAALEANLDAPFACKAGSCSTCRAKVVEGKALMNVNYALSETEIEEGYILTCQAHCITPTVTIDYDQAR